MDTSYLFVYGTLMSCFKNPMANLLKGNAISYQKGFINGLMYLVAFERFFPYPIVIYQPNSGNNIYGEIVEIPKNRYDSLIKTLNEYEGNEYSLEEVFAFSKQIEIKCLSYVGKESKYPLPLIESGDWEKFMIKYISNS